EADGPRAVRERGYRDQQLRRAPAAPDGGGAVLRADGASAPAGGRLRPWSRPRRQPGNGVRSPASLHPRHDAPARAPPSVVDSKLTGSAGGLAALGAWEDSQHAPALPDLPRSL